MNAGPIPLICPGSFTHRCLPRRSPARRTRARPRGRGASTCAGAARSQRHRHLDLRRVQTGALRRIPRIVADRVLLAHKYPVGRADPALRVRTPSGCARAGPRATATGARARFARMRQTPGTVAIGPESPGIRRALLRNSLDTGTRPAAPVTPAPAAPPSRWSGGQLRAQRQREQARLDGLTIQVLRLIANS